MVRFLGSWDRVFGTLLNDPNLDPETGNAIFQTNGVHEMCTYNRMHEQQCLPSAWSTTFIPQGECGGKRELRRTGLKSEMPGRMDVATIITQYIEYKEVSLLTNHKLMRTIVAYTAVNNGDGIIWRQITLIYNRYGSRSNFRRLASGHPRIVCIGHPIDAGRSCGRQTN